MRIDAHQHFWNYDPRQYGWIGPDMDVLKKDFLPPDLEPLLKRSGMDGCVAVQARQTEAETNYLLQLCERYDFVNGVVGWLDLTDPQVDARINAYSGRPHLKGIRHTIQSEPAGYMTATHFMRGVRLLAPAGLTYDLLISESQLEEAYRFITGIPETKIVIDHIAKPAIRHQSFDHWACWMKKISGFPNVYVKLSGLVTEADWSGWKREDLYPYLEFCLEHFQPGRLMIGSDWPVCQLAADYLTAIAIVSDYIQVLSQSEQEAILGNTAIEFYHLDI